MTRTKSTYLALLAILLSPMAANADVIFSGSLIDNSGTSADGTSVARLWFLNYVDFLTEGRFDENLDTTSVGTTFTYDSGADFDGAVEVLTDGLLGAIFAYFPISGGTGIFENSLFSAVSLNGEDLGGYVIDSLQWTIDSYVFDSSTEMVSLQSTLTVNGTLTTVPEPGTLALLCIGLLGMGAARRRKKA